MMSAAITLRGVDARVLRGAIGPELDAEPARATAEIRETKDGLTIRLEAEDVAALRAALNSYLRWLKVISDIEEELKDGGEKDER